MAKIELVAHNIEALQRVAAKLAKLCKPGDYVALSGALGAGKTSFAQGFVSHYYPGVQVTSPTFNLVQIYDDHHTAIWHIDAYRVEHAEEAYDLGVEDVQEQVILLVEWPENISAVLPNPSFSVMLDYADLGRHITVESTDDLIEHLESLKEVL